MRRFVIGLSNAIHAVARRVAVLAIVVMFATVMLQIVARYVFDAPPVWTEDIARYMMVWTGLLGATLSFKARSDAVLLDSVFPRRPRLLAFLAEALRSAAVITFAGPVLWYSFIGLRGGFAKGYLARQATLTADTLGIPMVWIAVAVPLSMAIVLVHLAARWAEPETS
jgi:TRAP-type C4-dicarboxylate transport system permease small subunit